MTENITITLIFVLGVLSVAVLLALFANFNGSQSNFQALIDAWIEKRLAELEVKKLQAQHERTCPRLTDTPRSK